MDEIYGVSLERLAEFGAKYSEFQAKFAQAEATAAFDEWLLTQGTNSSDYWLAHNGWQNRFRADPTGELYARFTMMSAEHAQQVHFGDVRDMSQDTQEGVTLDQYAELTVAMAKPGIDAEAIAREHGLTDAAHWQRVNAAWSQAMSQDLEHKLTTQFGQLYQKHAGPTFAEEQLQATAAILAESNQPQDRVDEPVVEETPDTLLEKLSSASRAERWQAARMLAHAIDIGAAKGSAYRSACVPVLIDIIEHHDEHTASDAEDAARRLMDLGERSDDAKSAMTRCLNRAEEKLTSLKAAFAPIADRAVPERVTLQSRIQSYGSLVSSLQGYLAGFQEVRAAPASVPSLSPGVAPIAPKSAGGLAFVLPLVAVLLIVGGGAAFWLSKRTESATSFNASLAASETAAVPTASAVPVTPVAPLASATTAESAASPASSAPPANKLVHKGKPHRKAAPKH